MGPDKMNHRTPTLIYGSIQKGLEALMKADISASSFTIVLYNGEPVSAYLFVELLHTHTTVDFSKRSCIG